MAKKSITSDQVYMVLRNNKKYPNQNAILRTDVPQPKDLLYKNTKTTKASVKSKPTKEVRATKRGTPVKMPARTTKPVGNMPMKPGNIATGAKKTAKPMPTAKPKKPLTSSEKAFLEGQKKKAQITKKTGVYPNTAN